MMSPGSALAGLLAARACPDDLRDRVAARLFTLSTYLTAAELTEHVDRAIAYEIADRDGALRSPGDQRVIAAARAWRMCRHAALTDPTCTADFIAAICTLDLALADMGVHPQ